MTDNQYSLCKIEAIVLVMQPSSRKELKMNFKNLLGSTNCKNNAIGSSTFGKRLNQSETFKNTDCAFGCPIDRR